MVAVAYALPQLLYRRTSAHWLLPLVPLLRGWLDRAALRGAARVSSSRWWTWPTRTPRQQGRAAHAAENIEALISAGAEEGLIEEEDRKLIQSVVEFGDKVVREVMTPRPNIVAIAADATLEATAPAWSSTSSIRASRCMSRTSTR